MVSKKVFWVLLPLILGVLFFVQEKKRDYLHIFVNETSDHRFDESIKMSILAAYKRSSTQNAVVISDKAYDASTLFRDLEIGKKTKGRGILYVYSPARKSFQIEVGYALEGLIPDIKIRNLELAAKSFIYSDQFQDFWAEIINTMNIEVARGEKDDFDYSKFKFLSGGGGVSSTSYEKTFDQFRKESKTQNKKLLAGTTVTSSLDTYLISLASGNNDFSQDILTEEAQFRRKVIFTTSYQLYRNYHMYERAGIDAVIEEGNLAFVFFKPSHPVLPIVLRREGKVWRVHEPLSWSLFHRFEDSMDVFLKFPLEGPEKLRSYLRSRIRGPLYFGPSVNLEFLAKSVSQDLSGKEAYFKFALFPFVAEELREAADADHLWILADAYQNLGQFTNFVRTYEKLVRLYPTDKKLEKNLKFYREIVGFKDENWLLKID